MLASRGGDAEGGGILFNRKLTSFAQDIHSLKERLDKIERRSEAEKSRNDRSLLEFAELGEKMRRTYLRLSRIVKVDSKEPSTEEPDNGQQSEDLSDPQAIRDAINKSIGI